nr:MAG TPA: hypothetical protein [Caudoviricetes sp.]
MRSSAQNRLKQARGQCHRAVGRGGSTPLNRDTR